MQFDSRYEIESALPISKYDMLQVKVNFNKPDYETNLGNSIFSHQPKILVNKKKFKQIFQDKMDIFNR